MEAISLSQRILSGLSAVDALPKDEFARLCKYILQVVVTGNSGLEIGAVSDMSTARQYLSLLTLCN